MVGGVDVTLFGWTTSLVPLGMAPGDVECVRMKEKTIMNAYTDKSW